MRTYRMMRDGAHVADVVEFSSGLAAVAWTGACASVAVYRDLGAARGVHLHHGTTLEPDDADDPPEWRKHAEPVLAVDRNGDDWRVALVDGSRRFLGLRVRAAQPCWVVDGAAGETRHSPTLSAADVIGSVVRELLASTKEAT